jgi:hypothetical protein
LCFLSLEALALEKYFPDIKADFSENIDLYCIEEGDSLASIALKSKVSPSFLLYINNGIDKHENFYVGKTIKLPGDNIKSFINSRSRHLNKLISKLDSKLYKDRKDALQQLINKDWRAVPILLKNRQNKNIEIRSNVKDALKQIFSKTKNLPHLDL